MFFEFLLFVNFWVFLTFARVFFVFLLFFFLSCCFGSVSSKVFESHEQFQGPVVSTCRAEAVDAPMGPPGGKLETQGVRVLT